MWSSAGEDGHSVQLVQRRGRLRYPVWQPSLYWVGAQWHAHLHRVLWHHHPPLHLLHPGKNNFYTWNFSVLTLRTNLFKNTIYFSSFSSSVGHIPCRLEKFQPVSRCHSLLHQCLLLCGQHWLAGPVPGWCPQRDRVQEWQHNASRGAIVSTYPIPTNQVSEQNSISFQQNRLLSSPQIFRDAVVRHHLHHRLLLHDVRCDLVCHAHLRLAHVL